MKFTTIFLFLLISNPLKTLAAPEVPKLFFSYSWPYDSVVCEKAPDKKWVDEIVAKTEHFSKIWSEKSPILFKTLFEKNGLGFSRKELTATFSVCPKKMSYSNPLILEMNRYLKTAMAPKSPSGADDFVDLVFHELLHVWVVEHLGYSKLIDKYKKEPLNVQYHLHVMAAQKFVYLKLKRSDLLQMMDSNNEKIGGDYARAWEIVNKEGVDVFLGELTPAPVLSH